MLPVMDELIGVMCNISKANSHIAMLSRTHGQVDDFNCTCRGLLDIALQLVV